METISEGDLVEIRFIDLLEVSEWTEIRSIRTTMPPKCKLIGHYLNESDGVVRVINFISDDLNASYTLIPRGVISSITKIEEGEIDDL